MSRANKDFWMNLKPGSGRPFNSPLTTPDGGNFKWSAERKFEKSWSFCWFQDVITQPLDLWCWVLRQLPIGQLPTIGQLPARTTFNWDDQAGEACATRLCSHTFSVGLILEPWEGWIVTSSMLTPRQTNRPKRALTSICMEVTYKCRLLGLSLLLALADFCSHVAVVLAWLLHWTSAIYVNCPWGKLPTDTIAVGSCPVGNCLVGNCLVGNCLVGNCPVGSWPIGSCLVGNWPDTVVLRWPNHMI